MTELEHHRLAATWLGAKQGIVLAERRIEQTTGHQRTTSAMALLRHCVVRDTVAEVLTSAGLGARIAATTTRPKEERPVTSLSRNALALRRQNRKAAEHNKKQPVEAS